MLNAPYLHLHLHLHLDPAAGATNPTLPDQTCPRFVPHSHPHAPAAAMEATMLDPVEREQPSAPINNRFLMLDFKVKPCQLRRRCKGPDNCVYLHPGEKGRRDPLQSCYDLIPCASYRQNGGSCPHGDGCRRAHGVLELRFHPSAYLYAIRFKFKDLEAYLTGTKLLPAERYDHSDRSYTYM